MALEPMEGRLTQERSVRYERAGYWPREIVTDALRRQARAFPDKPAVVEAGSGGRRVTWRQLDRLSRRLAVHFRHRGLGPGDVIAVQLPNRLEAVVAYFAVQYLGGTVLQLLVDWRDRELLYGLGIGPAKAILIPSEFRGVDFPAMIGRIRRELPELEHVFVVGESPGASAGTESLEDLLSDVVEAEEPEAIWDAMRPDPDAVSRVVFTSGTTGLPKPVLHTHRTGTYAARNLTRDFGLGAHDVILLYLPLATNYGVDTGLHPFVLTGATLVLMERFSPDQIWAWMEKEKVTFFPGTPTAYIALLNSPEAGKRDVSSLRRVVSAGAPCPMEVIQRVRQVFRARFVDGFGMNEFGLSLWAPDHVPPAEADGTVGLPAEGVAVRIADPEGREVSPGETGELQIQSPGMCVGYAGHPDAHNPWDPQGWFRTGDLARIDENGYLRIVGRVKDVILRGGASVAPREVEEALLTHPEVRDACVIGLPDDYYGEIVCACIIPREGCRPELEALREHLKPMISYFKLPERLVCCDAFPLNSMGKVQRGELRQRILEEARFEN